MEHLAEVSPDQCPERDSSDTMMTMLQDKGEEHEKTILNEFIEKGLSVVDVSGSPDKELATIEAMNSGEDVIYQACISKCKFKGYADFLV